MMKIFTMPSSTGSRRAMQWMKDHRVQFTEQRLDQEPLTIAQLKGILLLTDDGTDDIISKRSLAYKGLLKQGLQMDDMTITELRDLIEQNPRMLRFPIIVDQHKLMVGFDEDRVRVFLPRMQRMARYARQLDEVREREDVRLKEQQLKLQMEAEEHDDMELELVGVGSY